MNGQADFNKRDLSSAVMRLEETLRDAERRAAAEAADKEKAEKELASAKTALVRMEGLLDGLKKELEEQERQANATRLKIEEAASHHHSQLADRDAALAALRDEKAFFWCAKASPHRQLGLHHGQCGLVVFRSV